MKQEKMTPNKLYRNVTVEGCKMAWVRKTQKPAKRDKSGIK